ncbi:MAG: hypothetical protein ACK46X_10700 [Candidatus Sericytochromatia bacterium]
MKRIKKQADGHMDVEELNVDPRVPSIEEIERAGGGGGGSFAGPNQTVKTYRDTHETRAEREKRAPSDGHLTVEIDQHNSHLRLPEHPRGQGWIAPDPRESILPEDE